MNLKDETNILLLGVSGVGKSTFVNSFVNYLAFGEDYNRARNGLIVSIRSKFIKYDDYGKGVEVDLAPEDNDDEENDISQEPRCYSLKFTSEGKEKIIRLIDTPGLLNLLENDHDNVKKIVAYLKNFPVIQAICILLSPYEPRLTPTFQYVLREIFSLLHKDATKNILFCFPNTRGRNFTPGDTYFVLEMLLKELQEENGVDIPIREENIFCFDNDGFRRFAAEKFDLLPPETSGYSIENWMFSVKETKRMLNVIATLPDYEIKKSLAIHKARTTLSSLVAEKMESSEKCVGLGFFLRDNSIVAYNKGIGRILDNYEDDLNLGVSKQHFDKEVEIHKRVKEMLDELDEPLEVSPEFSIPNGRCQHLGTLFE